jgi:hypothetical protein
MKLFSTRVLILTLTFSLCGLPEAIAQSAKPLPDAPSASRLLAQNAAPTTPQPAATQDPAQPEQEQPVDTQQTGDQPRVVPVDPAQAPGTQDTEQQPDDAAAFPQSQPPKTIAPADPAELEQLENAQRENTQQSGPVNERINPLGTAAAEKGKTAGGAASRPAGVAIAPAKQKRSRSLLIKLGAVAAAAAALGTVYGLSRSTKGTPQAVR